MGLASDFGLLFLLDARDQAEATIKKADTYLNKFADTASRTGEIMKAAGEEIDSSLLKTASGADALEVASARVEGAQAKLTAATEEQAAAEKNLLEVRSSGTASADELSAANDKLSAASKQTAVATKELSDAQKLQADTAKAAAAASDEAAVKTDLTAEAQKKAADASKSSATGLSGVTKAAGLMGIGMAAAGYEAVKMAGNFQDSTTHLVTDAGESQKKLAMVQAGILNVSSATGTSASAITDAMYHIESGGFHAQAGLDLLTTAAEGAKVGGADLDTVSKTLVGTMRAYGPSIGSANQVMNMLVSTVGQGDMKMQDLASSLGNVAPTAAKAGITFNQLGAAIATMTSQNMSADQASQDLNATIGSLMNPTHQQITEMQQLGLSSTALSNELGKQGLTATMQTLTQAVAAHTKGGQVWMSTYQNATVATQDLQVMLKSMPPQFQSMAKGLLDGTVSAQQWRQELQQQTPINQHLMSQFASLADKANSFSTQLTSASPASQTINAAMAKLTGTSAGLRTALMLTGSNASDFANSAAKIKSDAGSANGAVAGWSTIQGTFNFKMQSAKTAVQNTAIALGTALLPAMTSTLQAVVQILEPIVSWISKHQDLTKIIFASVTAIALLVATIGLASKAFKAVKGAIDTVHDAVQGVGKLFGLFSSSADAAAASSDGAAASADGLAASEDGLATSTEASTVATDANSTSLIRSGLAAVGAAAKYLAMKTAQLAVRAATLAWTAAQWLFNAAMDANPIMLVVIAIAALAAGVIYAYQHFTAFRDVVNDVFNWLKQAVVDVIDFVKSHWELIVGIITLPIGGAALIIYKYWDQIKGYFSDAVHAIEGVLSWFGTLAGKFASWLASVASSVARGIADVVSWWLGLPGRVTSAVFGYFSGLAGKFGDWIEGIYTSTVNKGADVLKWFKDLPGKITAALGDLSSTLWNAGVQLIEGLVNGIGSMFDDVKSTLGNLASDIVSWKGPPAKDKILLTDNGKLVIQGLIAGFNQEIPAVQAKLQGLTATIKTSMASSAMTPAISAPSLAAPVGGSANVINVNLDGAFRGANILSDRGMDDVVDKIGRVFATRIGPASGFRPNM